MKIRVVVSKARLSSDRIGEKREAELEVVSGLDRNAENSSYRVRSWAEFGQEC